MKIFIVNITNLHKQKVNVNSYNTNNLFLWNTNFINENENNINDINLKKLIKKFFKKCSKFKFRLNYFIGFWI